MSSHAELAAGEFAFAAALAGPALQTGSTLDIVGMLDVTPATSIAVAFAPGGGVLPPSLLEPPPPQATTNPAAAKAAADSDKTPPFTQTFMLFPLPMSAVRKFNPSGPGTALRTEGKFNDVRRRMARQTGKCNKKYPAKYRA